MFLNLFLCGVIVDLINFLGGYLVVFLICFILILLYMLGDLNCKIYFVLV